MPIPKPGKNESQSDFISRCMGNPTMNKEYPNEKQRSAVCYSSWRKPKQSIQLKYTVPIVESNWVGQDFYINGTAINSTTTSNKHKFLSEELEKGAPTIIGVPILVDHRNEVSAIKGRVIEGGYDSENNNIKFKGRIRNKEIQDLIVNELLNSVSVGVEVEDIIEEDNVLIPKGIIFRELSLVAVPADAGATFTMALTEAYNLKTSKVELPIDEKPMEVKMAEIDEKKDKPAEKEPEEKPADIIPDNTPDELKPKEEIEKLNAMITEMKKELDELKKAKSEVVTEKKEVTEQDDEDTEDTEDEKAEESLKFEEGFGSLRGGATTVVR